MGLVYQTGSIIVSFQAFNGFNIELTRAGETFDELLSRTILQGMLKVHKFLGVRERGTIMYRDTELFPK